MVKFKIGYLSTVYHTSFILKSEENGFVNGVDQELEWILHPTGPAMMDSFRTGSIDLGYIGLPPVMMGIDKELRLKCVAGGHVEGTVVVSSDSFQTFEELGNTTAVLKQFEGGKIGTPAAGSIHDVILKNLIKGLDISIVNYSWADFIPDAIEDGEILAGVGTPSLATVARRQLDYRIIIPPQELWPYNPSYGIVVQEALIDRSPHFIRDFLLAHESACNLIREEPLKAASIAVSGLGNIDVKFVLETYQSSPKYCASLPPEYVKSTLDFVPVLKSLSIIKKNLKEEDIFNRKFIQEIHPKPSHYDLKPDLQSLRQ